MAKRAGDDGRKPVFRFSKEAADELSEILGHSAAVIVPQLETLLDDHLRFLATYHGDGRNTHQCTPVCRRDIKKIAHGLETLIRRIDEARPGTKEHLQQRGSPYALMVGTSAWDDLTLLRESTQRILTRLAPGARHARPQRKRGAPTKPERRSLADWVALILRANSVRITSGGTFERVMQTALAEAEGKAPQDLYRLLKPASDAVKEFTAEECRHAVDRAFRSE